MKLITVSHTYIACANAILQCGAEPVFVDVDPKTFNMDPALVEAAITRRTRAIAVRAPDRHALRHDGHHGGGTRRHGLPVVRDGLRPWLGSFRRRLAAGWRPSATSPVSRSIRAR